jgi:hypothetical protein
MRSFVGQAVLVLEFWRTGWWSVGVMDRWANALSHFGPGPDVEDIALFSKLRPAQALGTARQAFRRCGSRWRATLISSGNAFSPLGSLALP